MKTEITEFNPAEDDAQVEATARGAEVHRLMREQEVEDFKWLMGHKQGRRNMWRFLSMTALHSTPHVMGASSEDNAFRAGCQNIGIALQALIHEHCPDTYHLMVKERQAYVRSFAKREH